MRRDECCICAAAIALPSDAPERHGATCKRCTVWMAVKRPKVRTVPQPEAREVKRTFRPCVNGCGRQVRADKSGTCRTCSHERQRQRAREAQRVGIGR